MTMDKTRVKCYSVADYEKQAELKITDTAALGYFNGGTEGTETLRDNLAAFSRYKLRPRHMRDISTINTKQRVLGCDIDFPVVVAPFAFAKMAHPDGEYAVARACAGMDTAFTLSSWTSKSIDDVTKESSTGVKWLQLYLVKDRRVIVNVVRKAERHGFKAILVTIDLKIPSNRLTDKRNQFTMGNSELLRSPNASIDDTDQFHLLSLSWDDISWLKSITKLQVAVKGVMTREDAIEAVQHGVDGIVVSNHGGRALDCVEASIDALSEIVEAVKHSGVDILMDSGIRKGTDVIKALALGAKAVMVGRPIVWGLAVDGENGVKSVLEILKNELRISMGLCGCQSLSDINQTVIKKSTSSRL
ncbi:2-Hydroxyacid oxidase 1-like [Antedon mediterranea]|uniref:2-Hydroxyacid oxidase 1-like n=1 Tax=Antedon mediterranea TaxID=105859 RepID=UPI003AF5F3DC